MCAFCEKQRRAAPSAAQGRTAPRHRAGDRQQRLDEQAQGVQLLRLLLQRRGDEVDAMLQMPWWKAYKCHGERPTNAMVAIALIMGIWYNNRHEELF